MGISTPLPDRVKALMRPEDRKAMGKAGMTTEEALAKADLQAERDIQAGLAGLLAIREVTPLVMPFGKKSGCTPGWPDLTFAYLGIPCAWEVKTVKGTCQPEQIKMRVKLERDGWRYEVVRSIEQARGILNQLLAENDAKLGK